MISAKSSCIQIYRSVGGSIKLPATDYLQDFQQPGVEGKVLPRNPVPQKNQSLTWRPADDSTAQIDQYDDYEEEDIVGHVSSISLGKENVGGYCGFSDSSNIIASRFDPHFGPPPPPLNCPPSVFEGVRFVGRAGLFCMCAGSFLKANLHPESASATPATHAQ